MNSANTDPIIFDLEPIEVSVSFRGQKFILKEATEAVRKAYRNKSLACMVHSEDGRVIGAKGLADVEAMLVSLCLFREDGKNPVLVSTLDGWPGKFVNALFERVKEISGLKEEEETEKGLAKVIQDAMEKLKKLRMNEEQLKNLPSDTELSSLLQSDSDRTPGS